MVRHKYECVQNSVKALNSALKMSQIRGDLVGRGEWVTTFGTGSLIMPYYEYFHGDISFISSNYNVCS